MISYSNLLVFWFKSTHVWWYYHEYRWFGVLRFTDQENCQLSHISRNQNNAFDVYRRMHYGLSSDFGDPGVRQLLPVMGKTTIWITCSTIWFVIWIQYIHSVTCIPSHMHCSEGLLYFIPCNNQWPWIVYIRSLTRHSTSMHFIFIRTN